MILKNMLQEVPLWKKILRQNFTKLDLLADYLELDDIQKKQLFNYTKFPLNLPLRLAQKIKKGTLEDPLFLQFLPLVESKIPTEGFVEDPVGDSNVRCGSKLLRKYNGRVLLVCTSACAMHCRYCFRQNFDYETADKTFSQEIALIAEDPTIREVILSGGDPLSLSNETLDYLITEFNRIPHIKHIRFHTRFPIGIPERIDDGFLDIIKKIKSQVWFVIHCNHARELDEDVLGRLKHLRQAGCHLLNQWVLLKGVNDDAATLIELCEKLVDNGIMPYYLHQLDRVQGAGYFEVDEEKGRTLIREISKFLPGYALPRYVREIAGEPNKTPL